MTFGVRFFAVFSLVSAVCSGEFSVVTVVFCVGLREFGRCSSNEDSMVARSSASGCASTRGGGEVKRAGGRRIKNSALGIRRAPHAFALYLTSVKQHVRQWSGRRLRGKQAVWRLDLLSLRFRCLSASERAPFGEAAAAAKRASADSRALALVRRRVKPIARLPANRPRPQRP